MKVRIIGTVELRYSEVPRDWENAFVIMGVRYIGVLFHTFYYNWAEKKDRSLYRGLRYKRGSLYQGFTAQG